MPLFCAAPRVAHRRFASASPHARLRPDARLLGLFTIVSGIEPRLAILRMASPALARRYAASLPPMAIRSTATPLRSRMTTRRSAPASLALARLLSICPPPLRARLGAYAPTPAARLLSQSESCRSPATARRPTDGIAIVYSSLRDFALAGLVIQDKMQRPRTIALSPADIAPAFVERSTKRSPLNQLGSRPVYRGLDVNRAPPGALRPLLKHSLSQAVSLSYGAKAPPDSVSSDRRPSRSLRQPFRRAIYPWNQDAQSRSLDLLLPYRRSARTWPLPAQPADTGRACHYGPIRCIYHEDRAMQPACATNTHYRTCNFAHLCTKVP